MPIYEYVCEACGRLTEVMQRISDPAPATCPECGAARLARLVSRTSFQLKGGGWYADLYSSPKEKKVPGDGAAPSTAPAAAPAAPSAKEAGSAAPSGPSPASGASAGASSPSSSGATGPGSKG